MEDIKKEVIKHIVFIMDGNGRWAKKRSFPRSMGHKAGVNNIKPIVSAAFFEHNIYCLSLFTFSTENFKRPLLEQQLLFDYLVEYLDSNRHFFIDNKIRLMVSGNLEDTRVPRKVKIAFNRIQEETKQFSNHVLNILFAYGGQLDVFNATLRVVKDIQNDIIKYKDLNERIFESYLYTKDLPMVDLLVRTSGEKRISNCLLYQIAYAELTFVDTYWPDFTKEELGLIIKEYYTRKRRYGGV